MGNYEMAEKGALMLARRPVSPTSSLVTLIALISSKEEAHMTAEFLGIISSLVTLRQSSITMIRKSPL